MEELVAQLAEHHIEPVVEEAAASAHDVVPFVIAEDPELKAEVDDILAFNTDLPFPLVIGDPTAMAESMAALQAKRKLLYTNNEVKATFKYAQVCSFFVHWATRAFFFCVVLPLFRCFSLPQDPNSDNQMNSRLRHFAAHPPSTPVMRCLQRCDMVELKLLDQFNMATRASDEAAAPVICPVETVHNFELTQHREVKKRKANTLATKRAEAKRARDRRHRRDEEGPAA